MATKFRIPNSTGGGNWEPLPEGVYDIRINSVELTKSKTDTDQLKVGGDVAAGEQTGKKVTIWFALTEKAAYRVNNLCQALLVEGDPTGQFDADGVELLEYDFDALMGRVFRTSVQVHLYEKDGQTQRNNKFGGAAANFECSPTDPYYADVQAALREAGMTGSAPAATQAAPTPQAAPAPAPAPAIGRRPRLAARTMQ